MPRANTNDLTSRLPESVASPLTLIDPDDLSTRLTIDPANRGIELAGNARRVGRRFLVYSRSFGTTTASVVGKAIPAELVAKGNDGGFYTAPIQFPEDMDFDEPVYLYALLIPDTKSTIGASVVRMETMLGYGKHGDEQMRLLSAAFDFDAPANWNSSPQEALIDLGGGQSAPGNTFESGDYIALRVRLLRSDLRDTYDQSVHIAHSVKLEYTALRI